MNAMEKNQNTSPESLPLVNKPAAATQYNKSTTTRTFLSGLALGLFLAVILFAAYNLLNSHPNKPSPFGDGGPTPTNNEFSGYEESPAVTAGKLLSHNLCTGTGPITLSASPMRPQDFSILIPYGLVVGGHVTPIDHQYFSPTIFHSKRDTYPVFAMADGVIAEIGARPRVNPNNPNDKFEEYRIVFAHTCTFLTYYDLVTSLSPDIYQVYQEKKGQYGYAAGLNIPVTAGQQIGKIGGQTLDFAVWNTELPLTGFIHPELYSGEMWKLYTANPNDYVSPELKKLFIERNPRTVNPIEGKIDYDQPGKLVGNWFLDGTNGYSGATNTTATTAYWSGHLSIAPDLYDPAVYRLSFGNIAGEAQQFIARDLSFDASKIDVSTGLVKVELIQGAYVTSTGQRWDNMSLTKEPRLRASEEPVYACVLFQVRDGEKLDMETFVGKKCSQVSGFDAKALKYYR